mgnify:FL=1|tara:strand:+ start:20 stop:265 length:246 start_codon:yes stop_codon:yes gene_type:complete
MSQKKGKKAGCPTGQVYSQKLKKCVDSDTPYEKIRGSQRRGTSIREQREIRNRKSKERWKKKDESRKRYDEMVQRNKKRRN